MKISIRLYFGEGMVESENSLGEILEIIALVRVVDVIELSGGERGIVDNITLNVSPSGLLSVDIMLSDAVE